MPPLSPVQEALRSVAASLRGSRRRYAARPGSREDADALLRDIVDAQNRWTALLEEEQRRQAVRAREAEAAAQRSHRVAVLSILVAAASLALAGLEFLLKLLGMGL